MINVQNNPLKNISFPSMDLDYYRFIQWLENEVMEENPNYVKNPEREKADKIFSDHIERLNLSISETDEIISENNALEVAAMSESFVNGYLTALAITQGEAMSFI